MRQKSDRKAAQGNFFVSPFQHFRIFEPADKCQKVPFSGEAGSQSKAVQLSENESSCFAGHLFAPPLNAPLNK